jgi:hypothetical protein
MKTYEREMTKRPFYERIPKITDSQKGAKDATFECCGENAICPRDGQKILRGWNGTRTSWFFEEEQPSSSLNRKAASRMDRSLHGKGQGSCVRQRAGCGRDCHG